MPRRVEIVDALPLNASGKVLKNGAARPLRRRLDDVRNVDIELSPEDETFRDELRSWLHEHLVGEFRDHLGAGSPTDDAHWDCGTRGSASSPLGKWLSVTWPERYGGRGGTRTQEIVFQIEHARPCAVLGGRQRA